MHIYSNSDVRIRMLPGTDVCVYDVCVCLCFFSVLCLCIVITIMVDRRMPFASMYYNTRNHFFIASFWPSFCSICSLPARCVGFFRIHVFKFYLSSFNSFSASVFGILVLLLFFFRSLLPFVCCSDEFENTKCE